MITKLRPNLGQYARLLRLFKNASKRFKQAARVSRSPLPLSQFAGRRHRKRGAQCKRLYARLDAMRPQTRKETEFWSHYEVATGHFIK